jgi:RND family efflux transporter MFP subunit
MKHKIWWLGAAALLAAVFVAWHWQGKSATDAADTDAAAGALQTAAVVRVTRGPIRNTLTVAGNFKPFQDVDVHAKVAGYIRNIYVDVGDHVKEGQVLAILEVPELNAQLAGADAAVRRSQQEIRRAEGDLDRAKSAHAAAHAMYKRLSQAAEQQQGLVAQQEVDDAEAKDLEAEAQVSSAQAALSAAQQALEVAQASKKQYAAMANYTRIVAPFSGVITTRYADTGALIAAGTNSSTQSMPVVRLAEVSKLRLVLPIPESVAAQIHLGDPVKVRVQALNQDYVGKVSRFADSLDMQTRTMETEIDFANKDGRLMPGMYTETALVLAAKKDALLIPIEAVSQNGSDATVLVADPNGLLAERSVTLGIQGKTMVEVLSGLTAQDRVVIGSRSQFRAGQKVQAKEVSVPNTDSGAS